jgi:hypothetical protein
VTAPLDIADFQARVYTDPPCWQLVADVYTSHLGQEVEEYKTVSSSVRAIAKAFRLALHKGAHGFSQVAEPVDYAVVLMGMQANRMVHHCGIFYEGKVLHANPEGTLYQDLASLCDTYQLMEYWAR